MDTGRELVDVVRELDRHVGADGWDQPLRLFALVATGDLARREPALARSLGLTTDDSGWTPVEQEPLTADDPLDDVLGGIAWPPDVDGAALCIERVVLPPSAEAGLSPDVTAAAAASHPAARDVRLTVCVLRDGTRLTGLRVRGHDAPDDLVLGPQVVPTLADALARTFDE